MKYNSLKELATAFKAGELNGYQLMLDNDWSGLRYIGPIPEGCNPDSYQEKRNDEAREWFQGNGYTDLLDACAAAGISCEWV